MSFPVNTESKLLPSFVLTMKHPVPSWNALLGMGHWQRRKLKQAIQDDFLLALRATAAECLMKTTSQKSTFATYADTLESYLTTLQIERKSRSAKSKLRLKKKKKR